MLGLYRKRPLECGSARREGLVFRAGLVSHSRREANTNTTMPDVFSPEALPKRIPLI